MKTKHAFNVTYQGRIIGFRNSNRIYTHAVVLTAIDGPTMNPWTDRPYDEKEIAHIRASLPRVLGFCGSHANALKSPDARRFEKAGYKTEVVAVNQLR